MMSCFQCIDFKHCLSMLCLFMLAKCVAFTGMIHSWSTCFANLCWSYQQGHTPHLKRKKGYKFSIFSWNHGVWMSNILNNEHGIHQYLVVNSVGFLTQGYTRETLLDKQNLSRLYYIFCLNLVYYNITK